MHSHTDCSVRVYVVNARVSALLGHSKVTALLEYSKVTALLEYSKVTAPFISCRKGSFYHQINVRHFPFYTKELDITPSSQCDCMYLMTAVPFAAVACPALIYISMDNLQQNYLIGQRPFSQSISTLFPRLFVKSQIGVWNSLLVSTFCILIPSSMTS